MEPGSTVLLVEDNSDDVFFFKRAVQKSGYAYRISVARNGLEAIAYMEGDGKFSDRDAFPFPKFIVTDNRMPVLSGTEFLQWLKKHPQFHVVPTIILGGGEGQEAVDEAYSELQVHSYMNKPPTSERLEKLVQLIFSYWAECRLPSCKVEAGNPSP